LLIRQILRLTNVPLFTRRCFDLSFGLKSISVEFALKGYHPYLNVPGTLKRVIFKRCDRILHERRVDQVRRQQNTRTALETIYPLVNRLLFRYSLNNNVQKRFLMYHLRGSFPRNNFSMHCVLTFFFSNITTTLLS
jgi:hypothetical protein